MNDTPNESEDLYARIDRHHKEARQTILSLSSDWKRYFLALETVHRIVKAEMESGERVASPAMAKALEIINKCFEVA
jgi:hypothetical protein